MEDIKKITSKIEQEAEDYLSNFGFDFVYGNNSELYNSDDDWVGQYEHESVFSDVIKVYINVDGICHQPTRLKTSRLGSQEELSW